MIAFPSERRYNFNIQISQPKWLKTIKTIVVINSVCCKRGYTLLRHVTKNDLCFKKKAISKFFRVAEGTWEGMWAHFFFVFWKSPKKTLIQILFGAKSFFSSKIDSEWKISVYVNRNRFRSQKNKLHRNKFASTFFREQKFKIKPGLTRNCPKPIEMLIFREFRRHQK